MARMLAGILLLGLLGASCSSDQKILGIAIHFPEGGRERTDVVRVMAIIPGDQADCQGLLGGLASPGDTDYPIESQLTIQLPAEQSSGTIKVAGGRRLFYAEGEDADGAVILHGCSDVLATRDGPDQVVIELDWTTPPCIDAQDCDDGQYCNGDELCLDGECQAGSRDCDDDDPCTDDECLEELDRCSNTPVVDPPGEEGPVGDPTCSDGEDNDCDGQTDEADTGCISCTQDAECHDFEDCTADSCELGSCVNDPVDDGTACDDGQYCNHPDACSDGRCQGGDRDCSGVEDQCNGSICDELAGACVPVPVTEGTACEDGLFCTSGDGCDAAGVCQAGILVVCGEDCLTSCDEDNDQCIPDPAGTPCTDDGLFCTGAETCDDLGACVSSGDPCLGQECRACDEGLDSCEATVGVACTDDGLYCSGAEVCDDQGDCVGDGDPCLGQECRTCDEGLDSCEITAGIPCTDDGEYCTGEEVCDTFGACNSEGDPCATTGCGVCNEGTDSCEVVAGTPCDDGVDCTDNDICDAAGGCAGTPDHAYCDAITSGSLCAPQCFSDASGCGLPAGLDLTCVSPVELSIGNTSDCTLALTGSDVAAQESCLSCSAEVGVTIVEQADFENGSGLCDLDGWVLEQSAGNRCRDKIDNCAAGGAPRSCSDDFVAICDDTTFSGPVLRGNFTLNGNKKQWRLYKTLDLSDLDAPWVCYDMAESQAGASTGLLVNAVDSQNPEVQVDCLNGEPHAGADGMFVTRCAALPAWAAGSPDVTLTFIGHSDVAAETMYLDNITVRGWSGGCSSNPAAVFVDNFAACDQSNWTVTTGSVTCVSVGCSNHAGWLPGVFGDGPTMTMEATVDTGLLDGEVEVCFRAGSVSALAGDALRFYYDAGAGDVLAWENYGALGADGECSEFCVNLSGDEQVAHNPALVLRFQIDGANTIGIYGVTVGGEQFCDAAGQVTLSAITNAGSGRYDFTATDGGSTQLTSGIRCQWDPSPELADHDSIWFRP